jgi:hypothetical protein
VTAETFFVNTFQYVSLYWLASRSFVCPVMASNKLLNETTSQELPKLLSRSLTLKTARAAFAETLENPQRSTLPIP